MTVIESKQNPFSDFILFVMLLINQVIIYLVEKFSVWLRRVCGVWETRSKPAVENGEDASSDNQQVSGKAREPDISKASDKANDDMDREDAKDDLDARLSWPYTGQTRDFEQDAKASG